MTRGVYMSPVYTYTIPNTPIFGKSLNPRPTSMLKIEIHLGLHIR